ncbi:RNA-binding protein S1 [Kyrpidia spormannii]|uniref:RNA degradation protein polyribonucleotide nucleotidyltransferase or phosphorylase n=2 Tax=Kyrpidia spormannii TaxID=2055160 RepID=A0ACA8Z5J6_9BACL|nr:MULTISPECIES: S1 domain-containing RNA-binding protein [Kyrpidia]HHY65729.1 RNA-binding protein S1 [Alicyclobacillus sp.]ATY83639.1 RNA-binding protein S1 [Kyrpidia spormannii]MCL6576382.1 RNA-binding protein S1 [Kyrpidia sp.]CAB3389264.1 putative RNA degradation protein; polyribonucleotide nucleotidyltransferase or phosphorylase [Kyrpidia spormannii]CAB3389790.1 putative RNA degradation protein; polyribonucleotide nucleotidyltransferase or phosphorylase [Kyrpidia spormannii]
MSIELGSKLEGKVTGITHFGAFVLLPGGVTGLVHISEIADTYVRDIRDYLKINDTVTVKVIHVDPNGKIGLSIRQAKEGSAAEHRGSQGGREHGRDRHPRSRSSRMSFEDKLNRFMKDSEERLQALKRSEAKRGGRGGRRG